MRKFTYFLFIGMFFLALIPKTTFAQKNEGFQGFDTQTEQDKQSNLMANLLYSQIGNQGFVGMRVQPEFAIGKLGFGLDVPIMFNTSDWKFRTDEYKSGIGWLRMIRYVRWGVKKRDPFYFKVGELSDSYIGYGMLVNNYSNSISFDKRKTGAEFDMLFGDVFGVEAMYSDFDFSSFNLLAVRPYIRPLGKTGIPVLKTLEFGATYVTDHDFTQIKTDSVNVQNQFIKAGQQAYAGDVGLQLINNAFVHLAVYGQYGYMMKNTSDSLKKTLDAIYTSLPAADQAKSLIPKYGDGSGVGAGVDLKVKFLDKVLRTDVRLERVWYNNYFVPQFFDVGYELSKDAKVVSLATTGKKQGTIGSLSVMVLSKITVGGSLWIPDGMSEQAPALLQLNADASQLIKKVVIKGYYVKTGITNLKDALKIDDRSLATLRVAYKIYNILEIGLDYKWTFVVDQNQNWKATNYMSPYFGLSIPLNF
jgi:hypothetical protein